VNQAYFNRADIEENTTPSPWADLFVSQDLATKEFSNKFSSYYLTGKPGAVFDSHSHPHAQILYFISGHGTGFVGTNTYNAEPGTVVTATGGEEHSLRNTSLEDMHLLVINIPAAQS